MYVKRYQFPICVVADRYYYRQYSKTYTLCSGLNRLQVYVTDYHFKSGLYKNE